MMHFKNKLLKISKIVLLQNEAVKILMLNSSQRQKVTR